MGFRTEKEALVHLGGQYADAVVRDMFVLHLIWLHFMYNIRVERELTVWFPDPEWPGSRGEYLLTQIMQAREPNSVPCIPHTPPNLCAHVMQPWEDPTCSREPGPQDICSRQRVHCTHRLGLTFLEIWPCKLSFNSYNLWGYLFNALVFHLSWSWRTSFRFAF